MFSVNSLSTIPARVESLERRVKGIEDTLNDILTRLTVVPAHDQEVAVQSFEKNANAIKNGPYSYRHLDLNSSEIRILALYSSLEEQYPIVCELLHASLDHKHLKDRASRTSIALQTFNTLSYTWGNLEKEGFVNLEGHQFPVTKNLEVALRHMRNLKGPSTAADTSILSFWWIDAICINQASAQERNQQVNLMTRIYKKAAGVHIWLGEEADNSGVALEVTRQLGDYNLRGPGEPDIVYPEITAGQKEIHWKALTALFERQWWDRVWVRQEVAVAREATVHCGNQTCTFAALATTADILHKVNMQLGLNPIAQETAKTSKTPTAGIFGKSCYLRAHLLSNFRNDMGSRPMDKFMDLRNLILHTRDCKATDLRDKVFSVFGLADLEFWQLKADYRLSVSDAFIAATRCVIFKKQSLDILSGAQNPERRNGLPSWVPNLIDEWKAQPLTVQRHGQEVASGEDPDFIFSGERNEILRVKGRRVDYIATLSEDTPSQDAIIEELDVVSANWKAFATTALSNPQIYIFDKTNVGKYKDDGRWVRFLSAGADPGLPLPQTAKPLATQANYQMAKSLLLPKDEDESIFKVSGMRKRIHEYLRKLGVGRRLCITEMGERKGSVVLVPADSKIGDEIWLFRGTSFPYILRKVKDGEYLVVGEGFSDRYQYISPADGLVVETISII